MEPASGGTLSWYRHLGHLDGTDRWEGPHMVGTEWDGFADVSVAGNGDLFAVELPAPLDVRIDPTNSATSGGRLLWYRHVGRADGSRRWEEPEEIDSRVGGFAAVIGGGSEPQADAAAEIQRFHAESLGVLTVGSPTGPVERVADDVFQQAYTFGTLLKPLGGPATIGARAHVSVSVAAIRCFGTDDPGGTDEPYLVSTVYALDPALGEKAHSTTLFGHADLGDVEAGDVFGKNRQLATDMMVPGDGEIRIHVQLWDEETLEAPPEKVKNATSEVVQEGLRAGTVAIGAAYGGPGGAAAAGGVLAVAEAIGILDGVGNAIGGVVADLFADNLVDQLDFVIPSSFLKALVSGDPATGDRTSAAIPGVTFNFPTGIEDDSWLFERGQGTYRMFFKITPV